MRSTFAGLNTMVRGITANQLSLDTTGHNITNAGTEGYSRQTVTLATTYSEQRAGLHGNVMVGTGVDAQAVERARDVYADIQYRNENPSQQYYKTMAANYDKLETIFDDSRNLGIESALNKFYQTWVDLSTNASNSSARTQVIEQGRNLSDILQTATSELQEQIRSEYEDLKSEIKQVDDMLEEIVLFNKQISAQEITGATANDLRDRRDLLVDQLSNYMNISFTENERGYQINSGGVTLVNGPTRAHLEMSNGVSSSVYGIDYGITDYNIKIKESDLVFLPQNGILKARLDSIAEDKAYIDRIADIASFMLTAFNQQHRQGWDFDGHAKFVNEDGTAFTGDSSTLTAIEYLDANGDYVAATNVEKYNDSYYNKTAIITKNADGTYSNASGDEVSISDVITVKNSDGSVAGYYFKVIRQNDDTTFYEGTDTSKVITKVPDTINFYGKGSVDYQYRYDPEYKKNYLYKEDPALPTDKQMLSGVQIIAELEVNAKFNENRGDRYIATATSYDVIETQNADMTVSRDYIAKEWGNRTGDGTNAVYMSELFNIAPETILSDGKPNALVFRNDNGLASRQMILRNLNGDPIDMAGNVLTNSDDYVLATAMTTLSINSYYQKAMSTLGIDAYSTDVNYEGMQAIMTQVTNWRDSTSGVDWNEELTNMIKFQKGFASCSRCLNAMDEMLEKLVNSTGVVGR
ncbi:MAG: flagellar hook-associated protein FlgK [Selenomonadaceae bacterium]|nr:flagellar hook-associated protein FlgK [Selenomonadaceae bacterium]